jgi:hypothetical protein
MNAGEQQQSLALTTEEEVENHQQMDDISKLKGKIEGACYQVTQREISKRPGLQNLQIK